MVKKAAKNLMFTDVNIGFKPHFGLIQHMTLYFNFEIPSSQDLAIAIINLFKFRQLREDNFET